MKNRNRGPQVSLHGFFPWTSLHFIGKDMCPVGSADCSSLGSYDIAQSKGKSIFGICSGARIMAGKLNTLFLIISL